MSDADRTKFFHSLYESCTVTGMNEPTHVGGQATGRCRLCGVPFGPDEQAFGSEATGWEHPFHSCPEPDLHADITKLIRQGRKDGKRPEVVAHAILSRIEAR